MSDAKPVRHPIDGALEYCHPNIAQLACPQSPVIEVCSVLSINSPTIVGFASFTTTNCQFNMSVRSVIRVAILLLVGMATIESQDPRGYSTNHEPESNSDFWKCNLAQNACHFRNQYNLARFSRYHNAIRPFHNEQSVLVLDLSTPNARKFPGARLISHYFPARRVNACLLISYLMVGAAPRAFYVIQQDKENKCIYSDENDSKNDNWRHIQLQLDLSDGDPRFFLEAQYDSHISHNQGQNPGYIALSKFSFKFGLCTVNNVNNCFADLNEGTIGQPPQAV